MRQCFLALSLTTSVLTVPQIYASSSLVADTAENLLPKGHPFIGDSAESREMLEPRAASCQPNVPVDVQVFIHESVQSRPWDAASRQLITEQLRRELKQTHDSFCDDSLGAMKLNLSFNFTFLSEADLSVPGMKMKGLLDAFGQLWQSGKFSNGSDMGLLYAKNSDSGIGGLSYVGVNARTKNWAGGPVVNWGWNDHGGVAIHEMGHFFGAGHDNEGNNASCPTGQAMGAGPATTWSPCSQRDIQRWIQNKSWMQPNTDWTMHQDLVTDRDGRLTLFFTEFDGSVYKQRQDKPNSGWIGENYLLRAKMNSVAAAKNADGRLEVFTVGDDGRIYYSYETEVEKWYPVSLFQNVEAQELAATTNLDGRLEVFWIGSDHQIYHSWQQRPGADWRAPFQQNWGDAQHITVARNLDGRLEAFWTGLDQHIYHAWQNSPGGVWSSGYKLVDKPAKNLSAEISADGRIQLFWIGTDDSIYRTFQSKPGADWTTGDNVFLQGPVKSLAIGRNLDGRLELFFTDANNSILHTWENTSNSSVWSAAMSL